MKLHLHIDRQKSIFVPLISIWKQGYKAIVRILISANLLGCNSRGLSNCADPSGWRILQWVPSCSLGNQEIDEVALDRRSQGTTRAHESSVCAGVYAASGPNMEKVLTTSLASTLVNTVIFICIFMTHGTAGVASWHAWYILWLYWWNGCQTYTLSIFSLAHVKLHKPFFKR